MPTGTSTLTGAEHVRDDDLFLYDNKPYKLKRGYPFITAQAANDHPQSVKVLSATPSFLAFEQPRS